MIASDDDLSSQWDQMRRFGAGVNATGYEYRPTSQNSNSFAAGALKQAGFLGPGTVLPEIFDRLIAAEPTNGRAHALRVPGFDQRLTNPLNMAVPPLDAVPFVPTNSSPADARPDSFDKRFENPDTSPQERRSKHNGRPAWLPPVGTYGAAGGKPERYLARRVPGQSEVSAFDMGAPAVPFISPMIIPRLLIPPHFLAASETGLPHLRSVRRERYIRFRLLQPKGHPVSSLASRYPIYPSPCRP